MRKILFCLGMVACGLLCSTAQASAPNAFTNVTVTRLPNGCISLTFDPSQEFGPTRNGKRVIVASTHGAGYIDGVQFTLNVTKLAEVTK